MKIYCALLLLFLLAAAPGPGAAQAQTELISNGGFDSFDGTGLGTSWVRWWEDIPNPNDGTYNYAARPEWSPESNPSLVHGGGQSQHIGTNWNPWHAGVYQTFSAAPGTQVRITAYGRVFASTPDFPNPSDTLVQARLQIGADPNGGGEWWSGNVQWSGTGVPHDTWQPFTLDVTAGASGRVTVFLSINYRGDSRYHLDAWWDSVSAVVTGAQPTPTATQAPLPTAAPVTAGPAPTLPPAAALPSDTPAAATADPATAPAATEVPTQNATPAPGSACVSVFEDTNGNGQLDGGEALIPGGQIQVADALQTVGTHLTDGVSEPRCFGNLSPGTYQITVRLPAGYFSTTGDRIAARVDPGGQTLVQFGAQSNRLDGPQATATPDSGEGVDLTLVLVIGGVGLVLLLAVAAAVFIVLRQR